MLVYDIFEYLTADGHSPFSEWLQGLGDLKARARIRTRLDRFRLGNPGDYASVGDHVFELRFFFGPGYRVYYGLKADSKVVLLGGGTKDTQQRNIRVVREYWNDYRNRNSGNEQKVSG